MSAFADKTFISESPGPISGGSGTSFNAFSICSITFSGFSMTFSPNLLFIKKQSSGGSGGADDAGSTLGTGPKKSCSVVCCGGREG